MLGPQKEHFSESLLTSSSGRIDCALPACLPTGGGGRTSSSGWLLGHDGSYHVNRGEWLGQWLATHFRVRLLPFSANRRDSFFIKVFASSPKRRQPVETRDGVK
jgi:hypothetical protein